MTFPIGQKNVDTAPEIPPPGKQAAAAAWSPDEVKSLDSTLSDHDRLVTIAKVTGDPHLAEAIAAARRDVAAVTGNVTQVGFTDVITATPKPGNGPDGQPRTVDLTKVDADLHVSQFTVTEIHNTPADPPRVCQNNAGTRFEMQEGVTIDKQDLTQNGGWDPPAVTYTNPQTGAEEKGRLLRFSTGDSYIVPEKAFVEIKSPDGGPTYQLGDKANDKAPGVVARYSATFCARSVRL
jgi:hypothetical protein